MATTVISIFIASRTATGDPASTSSPGATVTRHDQRRRRGPHDASLVSRHAMGDPIDLQEVIRAVGDRVDNERSPADHEPAREAAKRLDWTSTVAPSASIL